MALTFLDPVCTTDCPIIAQEFREADDCSVASPAAWSWSPSTLNPLYLSPYYLRPSTARKTSKAAELAVPDRAARQLQRVWAAYGASVQYARGGAMIAHSESAYVIDADGRIRYIFDTDPGRGRRRSPRSRARWPGHAPKGPRVNRGTAATEAPAASGRFSAAADRRAAAVAVGVLGTSLGAPGSSTGAGAPARTAGPRPSP